MKIILNSNDIHEVLKLSKADKVSFINQDGITYIIAHELKDISFKNQVIKRLYGYGEPGQALINIEVLKLIPKSVEVEITEELITVGKRKIKYKPNSLVDKPIEVEKALTTIEGKELDHLLSCDYAMSKECVRPTLNGICINNGKFVALDGFRIAVRKGAFQTKESVIVAADIIPALKKVKYDEDVEVFYNDNHVKFVFGDLEIIGSRQLGEFIEYEKIFPDNCTTSTEIKTKEILSILKDYKKNKFRLVKFNFADGELIISTNNKTITVKDKLPINLQGEPIEIMFNVNYLVDTFSNYEIVTLELTTNESPMMVKSENKLDLILPVRLVDR
ncbi:hypothetical protein [Haloimpatiens massiliensis]|uniref:DNA polymerase III subunit beta family protein n=1 Tax=Haloimpatiens massiliensis TaxID=1658110 RepID=UPI000C81A0BD|nr:hypothetical protein [Haloimpatiens massiliensis]